MVDFKMCETITTTSQQQISAAKKLAARSCKLVFRLCCQANAKLHQLAESSTTLVLRVLSLEISVSCPQAIASSEQQQLHGGMMQKHLASQSPCSICCNAYDACMGAMLALCSADLLLRADGTALSMPAATSISISLVRRPAAVTSAPPAALPASADPSEHLHLQEVEAGKVLLPDLAALSSACGLDFSLLGMLGPS